jgi:hypothetical protein
MPRKSSRLGGLASSVVLYVSNNFILLIVLLEIKRVIALIAINYKQLVTANYFFLYMLIKVL